MISPRLVLLLLLLLLLLPLLLLLLLLLLLPLLLLLHVLSVIPSRRLLCWFQLHLTERSKFGRNIASEAILNKKYNAVFNGLIITNAPSQVIMQLPAAVVVESLVRCIVSGGSPLIGPFQSFSFSASLLRNSPSKNWYSQTVSIYPTSTPLCSRL